MSKTDKTTPWWARQFSEPGLGVRHDHRTGTCRIETIDDARPGARRTWRARRHDCPRRVVTMEYCTTRAERAARGCPSGSHYILDENFRGGWVKDPCPGHRRVTRFDASVPCERCDSEPVPPTCYIRAPHGYLSSYGCPPSVGYDANRAERSARRAKRDRLRDLARVYTSLGPGALSDPDVDPTADLDLPDDPVGPRHRNSARWWAW